MRTILTILLVMTTVSEAYAQSSDSESATVSATVIASLSLAKDQNLAFGDVTQNAASTVQVTDAGAVKFTITGEPSKNITFTLTSPANLTNGGNNLTYADDVQYNTSDAPGTAIALTDGATIALNGSGNLYVYLGGTVTAGVGQVTGAYSGTFTVQVDY
jgi:allantoicase